MGVLPAVFALSLAVLAGVKPVLAQAEYVQRAGEEIEMSAEAKQKGDFVIAPIPMMNPTLGLGLILGVGYLFHIDPESYSSVVAAGGMYADGGDTALGAGGSLSFHENDWKISGGIASFDVDLDYYGIGFGAGKHDRSIRLNQSGTAAGFKLMRRLAGAWYLGLGYGYANLDSTFMLGGLLPPESPVEIPDIPVNSSVAVLGLITERDSRDNQFNPYRGSLFRLAIATSNETVGSDFSFSTFRLQYNHYWLLKEDRLVLAARGAGCAAPGDAPFYALCKLGVFPDLRGYVAGRYRDKTMLAGQAEIRWRFAGKWGMVAFGGFGGVAPEIGDYRIEDLLPSFGVGLRFLLSPENRLNIGIDYAVGENSDGVYFFVGEAF